MKNATMTVAAAGLAAVLSLTACGGDGGTVTGASSTGASSASSASASSQGTTSSAAGTTSSTAATSASAAATTSETAPGKRLVARSRKYYLMASDSAKDTTAEGIKTESSLDLQVENDDEFWMLQSRTLTAGEASQMDAFMPLACAAAVKRKQGATSAMGQSATIGGQPAKGCLVTWKEKGLPAAIYVLTVEKGGSGYQVMVATMGDQATAKTQRDKILAGWHWQG